MKPLTDRQQRILDYVRAYKARHGMAPSHRDIASGAHISSTSVVDHNLKRLEEAGYLRIVGGKSRGLTLPDETATADLRAVIEEAAADIEELAEWVPALEPAEMQAAIRARAAGLRAALQTAGVSL